MIDRKYLPDFLIRSSIAGLNKGDYDHDCKDWLAVITTINGESFTSAFHYIKLKKFLRHWPKEEVIELDTYESLLE